MRYMFAAAAAAALLFVVMLAAQEVGRRLAARRVRTGGGTPGGSAAVDAAVFALLGLLIAFTFSGAATRFDQRRQLVTQETNDIGTAYLRIDAVPPEHQPALRESFRRYLDARIGAYQKVPDLAAAEAELARANALQRKSGGRPSPRSTRPAPDRRRRCCCCPRSTRCSTSRTTRSMATKMHPPYVIFGLLFLLATAAALLAGYGMAGCVDAAVAAHGRLRRRDGRLGLRDPATSSSPASA